jgi:hypothetical protein
MLYSAILYFLFLGRNLYLSGQTKAATRTAVLNSQCHNSSMASRVAWYPLGRGPSERAACAARASFPSPSPVARAAQHGACRSRRVGFLPHRMAMLSWRDPMPAVWRKHACGAALRTPPRCELSVRSARGVLRVRCWGQRYTRESKPRTNFYLPPPAHMRLGPSPPQALNSVRSIGTIPARRDRPLSQGSWYLPVAYRLIKLARGTCR